VLHETAFAETKGSGIRVMRRLLAETNLAPPTFDSDRGRDEFVATFFLHNLLDDDDLAWLSHFAELKLTTDEAKALVHVREAGRITNAVYRDLNGVGTLEASSHLRRLRDLKLLQQHDRGAATYYTPTGRFWDPGKSGDPPVQPSDPGEQPDDLRGESGDLRRQPDDLSEQSGDLRRQPDNLRGKSGNLRRKSDNLREQPDDLRQKAGELRQDSDHAKAAGPALPPDLAEAVAQLNLWTPQPEMRSLIQRLCAWRPMSTSELSSILKRSKTYLRTSYIGPMVQAGELHYTNPGQLNDPGQKYRSTR
jgi:ATP-dependent DNA helicase RecG